MTKLFKTIMGDTGNLGYIANEFDNSADILTGGVKGVIGFIQIIAQISAWLSAKQYEKEMEEKYTEFRQLVSNQTTALQSYQQQETEIIEYEEDGETELLHLGKKLRISEEQRKSHMYVVGKTRSGKSKALQSWLTQDIRYGRGAAVIDAHGSLVEKYLLSLAQKFIDEGLQPEDIEKHPLMKKIIIVDPTDEKYAVGFNPLEIYKPFTPTDIGRFFEETIKKAYGSERGELPAVGEILRYTAATLAEHHYTLMEATSLLNKTDDTGFRARLVDSLKNEEIKDFWKNDFRNMRAEYIIAAKRRIRQFSADEKIMPIIGQKHSRVKLREAMDNGYIILCKIPTPIMGDGGSFLGALIVSQLQRAAQSRYDVGENQRKPFYLYIDEFQKFVTDAFIEILSEAAKLGLHFVISHQYSEQEYVNEKIQQAIIGNVKARVAFDVGADDAERLARDLFTFDEKGLRDVIRRLRFVHVAGMPLKYFELTPDYFSPEEQSKMNEKALMSLASREFIAMYDGLKTPQFDTTEDLPDFDISDQKVKEYYDRIKECCNKYWATPKKEVRTEIEKRRQFIKGGNISDHRYLNNNGKNHLSQTETGKNKS